MKLNRIKLIVLSILLFHSVSMAYEKSGTIYTTDGTNLDVRNAVLNSINGDTINIPAGNYTWDSTSITINKNIVIQGAGISSTVITQSTGNVFLINSSNASGVRITGIKINKASGLVISMTATATNFRFDHLHLNYSNTSTGINISWPSKTTQLQGLVDNCIFDFANFYITGVQNDRDGFTICSDDTDLGGPTALYVEDCVAHNWDNGGIEPSNFLDICCGLAYVSRYNEIHGYYHEAHGIQGTYNLRSTKKVEIYRNNLDGGADGGDAYELQTQPTNLRLAAAMVWQNDVHNYSWRNSTFYFSDYRFNASHGGIGQCDGNSNYDSNYLSNGWLCMDQPGAGADKSTRTSENPYPDQYQEPIYVWGNTAGNSVGTGNATYFVEDRDYFRQGGAVGISSGTLANRPKTCIEGQGYWATDQGSWNKATSGDWAGEQGVLYTCSVTGYTGDGDSGTWEVHYTPYEYPHPLRSESVPEPQPHKNLRVIFID